MFYNFYALKKYRPILFVHGKNMDMSFFMQKNDKAIHLSTSQNSKKMIKASGAKQNSFRNYFTRYLFPDYNPESSFIF